MESILFLLYPMKYIFSQCFMQIVVPTSDPPSEKKMAATETRSSDGVVYVKRDLYPGINSAAMEDDEDVERRHRRHCDDDGDDDVDHRPPVLKLARYAISPTVPSLLSLHHHHHNGYTNHHMYADSHPMTSPIPRRKQARPRRRSGDSSSSPPSSAADHHGNYRSTPSPVQDMPEDLSVKKSSPSLVSLNILI